MLQGRPHLALAGKRHRGDISGEARQVVQDREIELIELLQLLLVDLDHVEEAALAVVGEADRLRQAVEPAVDAVEEMEDADLAGVGVGRRLAAHPDLQPPQLLGEVLALHLVDIAAQLAVPIAPKAGNLVDQPLEPVAAVARFFESLGHLIPPVSRRNRSTRQPPP